MKPCPVCFKQFNSEWKTCSNACHIKRVQQKNIGRKRGKISKETREKLRKAGRKRIMLPMTEESKQKLRELNIKKWADPELRKKNGEKVKLALSKMSPEKKKKWYKNILRARRSPENKKRAGQRLKDYRKDLKWLEKSKRAQKAARKKMVGEKNPFYGKKHTVKTRLKISKTKKESPLTLRGENSSGWIDGCGKLRKTERIIFSQTLKYRLFREAVLKRDNWTCVLCKVHGGVLNVDHIKSYKEFPKLRTTVSNGRVLCVPCHKKTANWGRKKQI